jgi:hypothetical protein
MLASPRWEKNAVTDEWEWILSCDHGCCRKCTKDGESDCPDLDLRYIHFHTLTLVKLLITRRSTNAKMAGRANMVANASRSQNQNPPPVNSRTTYGIMLDHNEEDERQLLRKDRCLRKENRELTDEKVF